MNESFDYLKFVPGFDFLKHLSQPGQKPPSPSQWVAPTLEPEKIEKHIEELKTVQFWLEQNSKAVAATVQALEVQLMTLKTLKGMNMSMGDLLKSMEIKTPSPEEPRGASQDPFKEKKPNPFAASFAHSGASAPAKEDGAATSQGGEQEHTGATSGQQFLKEAQQNWLHMQEKAVAMWQEASNREHSKEHPHESTAQAQPQAQPQAPRDLNEGEKAKTVVPKEPEPTQSFKDSGASSGLSPDPMQWWSALTEQFSVIATQALTQMHKHAAPKTTDPHSSSSASAPSSLATSNRVKASSPLKASAKAKPKVQTKAKVKAKAEVKTTLAKTKRNSAAPTQVHPSASPAVQAKARKQSLSHVLAKTIADSDANPIQHRARKHVR